MERWRAWLGVLETGFAAAFYLAATLAIIWAMVEMSTRLARHDREMDRAAIQHEQMLRQHQQELKDHERLMQSR